MLNIHALAAFQDNYIWVIEHRSHDTVYIVDPGDAAPVLRYLDACDKSIAAILVTHQHWDHVSGIAELAAVYKCPVYGPAIEQHPTVTHPVGEGDTLRLWSALDIDVMETPGHMPDHISWKLMDDQQIHLFCADTLFSAGCGRIFRGTHQQLKHSLDRIAALPSSTQLFCAHEYTLSNLKFALAVEPNNARLEEEYQRVSTLRAKKLPSLPTILARELKINPFLRCNDESIINAVSQHVGYALANELEVFTELRQWKDVY